MRNPIEPTRLTRELIVDSEYYFAFKASNLEDSWHFVEVERFRISLHIVTSTMGRGSASLELYPLASSMVLFSVKLAPILDSLQNIIVDSVRQARRYNRTVFQLALQKAIEDHEIASSDPSDRIKLEIDRRAAVLLNPHSQIKQQPSYFF